MKKRERKKLRDGDILVLCFLFGAVVYTIGNMNGIRRNPRDIWLLLIPVCCMFVLPIIGNMIYYREKTK